MAEKQKVTSPSQGLRTGFTTGACSAAAAKAATRVLIRKEILTHIETILPNGQSEKFSLKRCESDQIKAICSVVKDAGDDPDCTHGAELTAEVILTDSPGVLLLAGDGVATVTKEGLGLAVGGPAINPVPRRNITEMVLEELKGTQFGAQVTISVPGGQEMALKTLNARLGLLGGISILGTSGIVQPYSTAAYKASVVQGIDVAHSRGAQELVFTTGGRSEKYAMELFPNLPEEAFIQVGDFIGVGIKRSVKWAFPHIIIVGMMGKLSKMADGVMMTHTAGSDVNTKMLAQLGRELSIEESLCLEIEAANTARHVLEICSRAGHPEITSLICQRASEKCRSHAGSQLLISVYLVDFDGKLLGQFEQKSRSCHLPENFSRRKLETSTSVIGHSLSSSLRQ